jgi:hypothetical protein
MANKNYIILILLFAGLALILLSLGKFFVQTMPEMDGKEWVEISIFPQCQEEPWKDTGIKDFFESSNINIYAVKIEKREVCSACGCPTPEKIEVLILQQDVISLAQILANYSN